MTDDTTAVDNVVELRAEMKQRRDRHQFGVRHRQRPLAKLTDPELAALRDATTLWTTLANAGKMTAPRLMYTARSIETLQELADRELADRQFGPVG